VCDPHVRTKSSLCHRQHEHRNKKARRYRNNPRFRKKRDRNTADILKPGGGSGIRTHVTVSRKHAFQACAFSHSATPPDRDLLHRPRLFTSKRNARLRVQSTFLTGHRKGRALRKAGQAPAARIDLRRRRRNCPAGGAHYSHRRTTDNRPHLANPASLISIIMFYFQRLTLMCVAAQNKHKCGESRGLSAPFGQSFDDGRSVRTPPSADRWPDAVRHRSAERQ
jgi:hypothetical protein